VAGWLQIDFDVHLIAYEGNDTWIEPIIHALHKCLQGDAPLELATNCDYCVFLGARMPLEQEETLAQSSRWLAQVFG
jgi:hypothetical protein